MMLSNVAAFKKSLNTMWHNSLYFIGREKKVVSYKVGKPATMICNATTGERSFTEGSESKKEITFEKVPSASKTIRVRITRGLKISIWLEVALLVVRHFAPEVEAQLPSVYRFLDDVALPIINWLYAIGLKGIELLMSQAWIASIIELLRNLAM